MKKRKNIKQIVERFQKTMQGIVDDGGITSITMQVEDNPPVVVAEKKRKGKDVE